MNIGQLFMEIAADAARLEPETVKAAEKAGDAGAKTLGQRLSKGFAQYGKQALAAGATIALGAMTKGALQLEEIQARIQAETGATADEAERMADAVNRIAGENRMSLDVVADAAIRVRRDLGATGDEADALTAAFARFARVTRQDAAGAVEAFDDILDSWGLTAADAVGIQDKLLVSQQRFGGSIEESQRTLAALAPAMRAANMEIDDGIALLNLFGAKGLDAESASAAFAKALTKVESPEELQRLIDDIAATEDPFLRAEKAAELFGARAGAKLANALGGANLDEYTVSMEEAAGATQKAADALDSTPWGWFQRKVSEAQAALRGFGDAFGPALTGLAALASMGETVFPGFGTKLVRGLKVPLGPLKKLGTRIWGGIAAGIVGSAGSGIVVDAIADGVEGAVGSPKLKYANSKLGKFMGSGLAKGLSVAFAAAAWIEVIETYNRIKGELEAQNQQISTDVANQIATGTTASLEASRAALEQGLRDINGVWDAGIFTTDTRKRLEADLAGVTAELERRAAGMGPAVASGVESGAPAVENAIREMYGPPAPPTEALQAAGEEIPKDIAAGILAEQSQVTDALASLRNQMKNELTPAQEIARNIGILTSEELAQGLKDRRPGVRAEAQRVQAEAEQRLAELIAGGGKVGKKASAELAAGLKSKNPQVRASAQRVKEIVSGELDKTKTSAGNAGQRAGEAFIARLKRAVASGDFHINASVGFTLPGKAIGGPVAAGMPYLVNEHTPRSEVFVPSSDGRILTYAQAVKALQGAGGGGGDTYNIPVSVTGVLAARTPDDVARPLRQLASAGLIASPRRQQLVRVPNRA